MKENPSAVLSKELLLNALLYYLKEKPYHEITITELSKKAQVGRRTFYRNFNTKDDILTYKIKKMSVEYHDTLTHAEKLDTYKISVIFFTILLTHIDFLLDLKRQGLMICMLNEFDRLLPLIHEKLITREYREKYMDDIAYVLSFHSGGFWNITNKWLEDGALKTPEQMADIVSKMMMVLV